MANLDLCGISLELQGLDGALDGITSALTSLTDGLSKGIAGSIESLSDQLNSALGDLESALNSLPSLPELPNLQAELNELLSLINNPLGFANKLAYIENIFGDAVDDINELINSVISGGPNFDICKLVPNIDASVNADGTIDYVKKGIKGAVPTLNSEKLPAAKPQKTVESVTPPRIFPEIIEKIESEEKEEVGSSVKPITPTEPPAGLETIIVNSTLIGKAYNPQVNNVSTTFIKTAAPDGSGFFWKPKGYSTQLEFETWFYNTIASTAASYRSTAIKTTSKALSAKYKQKFFDCIDVLKGTTDNHLTQRTKLADGSFSVNLQQAQRSFCPKPEGEWLGEYGIKV